MKKGKLIILIIILIIIIAGLTIANFIRTRIREIDGGRLYNVPSESYEANTKKVQYPDLEDMNAVPTAE